MSFKVIEQSVVSHLLPNSFLFLKLNERLIKNREKIYLTYCMMITLSWLVNTKQLVESPVFQPVALCQLIANKSNQKAQHICIVSLLFVIVN